MFIALTEVGKVLSVSSIDGSVLWSNYFAGSQKPEKVLIRNMLEREIDIYSKDHELVTQ